MIQEFYTKLSEKEKKIFYIAILFAVLALFDVLFIRPVMSKLNSLENEIDDTKNSIKRDMRFLSYREKISFEQKEFSKYQTDEMKTEEEIIAGFLKTVELIASEASINLVKLNPAEVEPKKGYIEYYANLECDGRLENLINFMHKIDMTQNLLKVVKLNLTGNKASADKVKVSMKISKLIIDPMTIGNYEFVEEEPLAEGTGVSGGAGMGKGAEAGSPSEEGDPEGEDAEGESEASDEGKSVPGESGAPGAVGGASGRGSGEGPGAVSPGEETKGAEAAKAKEDREGTGGSGSVSGGQKADAGGASSGGTPAAGDEGATQGEEGEQENPEGQSAAAKKNKMQKALGENTGGEMTQSQKSLADVWNDFWGIKPKPKKKKTGKVVGRALEDLAPEGYEPEENLWERLLVPEEEEEGAEE